MRGLAASRAPIGVHRGSRFPRPAHRREASARDRYERGGRAGPDPQRQRRSNP